MSRGQTIVHRCASRVLGIVLLIALCCTVAYLYTKDERQARGGSAPPARQHNYTLPLRLRQRALHNVEPTAQLRRLHRKLAGGPASFSAAVIGGSYSMTPHGAPFLWFEQVVANMQRVFPHLHVTGVNSAIGASSPELARVCLETLVPSDVDLLFVEFHPNVPGLSCFPQRTLDTLDGCAQFEILLRNLLGLPGHPAIVIMQHILPMRHHASWYSGPQAGPRDIGFHATAEGGIMTLATYYSIPVVSMRDAIWHLQRAGFDMFRDEITRDPDTWHLSAVGHTLAADAATHMLATVAAWDATDTMEIPASHIIDNPHLFPAMLPSLSTFSTRNWLCQYNDKFVNGSQLQVYGEHWQFGADDKMGNKFGHITHVANAVLSITWTPPPEWHEANHTNMHPMLLVGYLKSYTGGMGLATLHCRSGCTCESVHVDSMDRVDKFSLTRFVPVQLTAINQQCTIDVHVHNASDDAPHPRFKVNGFIVVEQSSPVVVPGVPSTAI